MTLVDVLSVCNVQVGLPRDHSHIRLIWNTSKIMSRVISLRFMLRLTPTWAIWCNGNIPKIRVEGGGIMSAKTCNISETVQDYYDIQSIVGFSVVPKCVCVTLNDLLTRPKNGTHI